MVQMNEKDIMKTSIINNISEHNNTVSYSWLIIVIVVFLLVICQKIIIKQ